LTGQFVVAVVGSPFGVKGFVKIRSFSGETGHLEALESVVLRREDRETLYYIEQTIRTGPVPSPVLAMKFRGIDSPEAAKTLTGAELIAGRDRASPLGEGEYYVEDLRGMTVVDASGTVYGEILDVVEGGGGDLAEIRLPSGEAKFAPFRQEFFGEISVESRRAVLLAPWILE
jgi:16S rRNA processing protein RimM